MGLQNAAAGFGVWSQNNGIIFQVPMLGSVAIGAKYNAVINNLTRTCQRRVDIRYKGRDTIFYDDTGDVLTITKVGVYIAGIKFHCAATQIPQNYVYSYSNKSYLSNICIEGCMIWVKNMNEVKLKEVSGVPCIAYSLADLGVTLERESRGSVQNLLDTTKQLRNKSQQQKAVRVSTVDKRFKQLEAMKVEASSLENKVYSLRDRLNSQQDLANSYKRKYDYALEQYNKAISRLNFTFSSGWSNRTIESLVAGGKLVKDRYGAWTLCEGSQVPTFYTQEEECTYEDTYRTPGRLTGGSRVISHIRIDHYTEKWTIAHPHMVDVPHRDEAFYTAKNWVTSRAYLDRHIDVRKTYSLLEEAKSKYDAALSSQNEQQRNPEYIADCVKYQQLREQLRDLNNKIELLSKELFK